jgi:hypothetical protein
VPAAATQPCPGNIPGQQGHDGERLCRHSDLDLAAERLRDPQGAGAETSPAPVLGKAQSVVDQAGQVHPPAGGESRLDERPGRHLTVAGGVRDQRRLLVECRQLEHEGHDGPLGGGQLVSGERSPSAAHLLPDRLFRAVHPAL